MKIQLKLIDAKLAGYDLIPENEEEMKALGSVREIYFWGSGEDSMQVEKFQMDINAIKYDGIETDSKEKYVTKMMFLREKYNRDLYHEKQEMYSQMTILPVEPKHQQAKPHFRCSLCHSADVICKAFVRPNFGNSFVDYSADDDDRQNCYCNRCEIHTPLDIINTESDSSNRSPELELAIDAAKPFSIFSDLDEWSWIADYSNPQEYEELDLVFRYLLGDIEKEEIAYKYRHLTREELEKAYQVRFQSLFGKAMQEIGKSVESGAIKITPIFNKK